MVKMAKHMIYPEGSAKPVGPYSPVIDYGGDLLFISGQIAINPENGVLAAGISAQTTQALKNMKKLVESAGATMDDCVKVTVYLSDIHDYPQFNDVYASYFSEPYPAREVVAVSGIPKGSLLEISAIVKK